jgi:hypothetical protein
MSGGKGSYLALQLKKFKTIQLLFEKHFWSVSSKDEFGYKYQHTRQRNG